ncbi:hypothetical protein [Streptomyces sp. NPDC050264]|uniref:hypothetical protein n=1 Tax=Streptomyces sp. NPDC050264 TaxID=3155038 RepID=UPI003426307A
MSDDQRFAYAGMGGVGKKASCKSTNHPEQDLYAVVQALALASGVDDEAAMKKLITGYTKAVERSATCR